MSLVPTPGTRAAIDLVPARERHVLKRVRGGGTRELRETGVETGAEDKVNEC